LINKYKAKHLIESSNSLKYGIYNGVVVDNKDPGYKNDGNPIGRVRVVIAELTDGIPVIFLPWYICKHNVSTSPNSQASIPPTGSEVIVEFPTDDIYNGIVSHVIISSPPR